MSTGMNIDAYLARIGIESRPEGCTAANLRMLQTAHLTHVPYETVDIVRGVPFTLEPEAIYDKVVNRRRGGYCFELNGLFAWLLRALGYPVTEYFGRFIRDKDPGIPMRRHRVLRVTTCDEGDFICDAGVGGVCPLWPLPMRLHTPWTEPNGTWRIEDIPFYGHLIEEYKHGEWHGYYCFTEEPQVTEDYEPMSFWCQNSPDSVFRKAVIACIQTPTGRIALRGREFHIFDGDRVEVIPFDTDEERDRMLGEYMGLYW